MKRNISVLLLGAALLLLSARPALAQSNAKPPTQLTYQGFLTDANGVPFGSTAPVNKTIIFRIYDALTGGNLKWSSQQVITVDKGYFSALLGQGSAVGGDPSTAFNPDLTGVFTGNNSVSDRYLELTADGTTIAPRLRFLPAPYAMLSKSATELLDPITGASSLSISGGNISGGGNLNFSNVSASGNMTGNNINASGTVTAGAINTGSVSSSGTVYGNALTAFANVSSHNQGAYIEWNKDGGSGMSYFLNQKGGGGGGMVFGEISTANTITERMRIDSAGNLGLGTSTPAGKLNVSEASGTVATAGSGTLTIDHGNSGGASSIVFRSTANRGSDFGYIQYQDAATVGGGGESAVLTIGIQNDGDDHLALMPSGNVGIGTTTPGMKLDVAGNGQFQGATGIGVINQGFYGDGGNIALRAPNGGATYFQTYGGGRTDMYIGNNGRVSIGANFASAVTQLDVRGTVNRTRTDFTSEGGTSDPDYLNGDHSNSSVPSNTSYPISIHTDGYLESLGAIFFSDRRIKEIIARANTADALKRIDQLQVTDYRMIDKGQNGKGARTGFIAQEVQAVLPDAVHVRQDFVPTVYTNSTTVTFNKTNQTIEVNLPKAHGFAAGDLVRLFDETGQKDVKALDVTSATSFVVAVTNQPTKVFVYGKQVNDFLSVDYDRVFVAGIAAIQELSKLSQQQAEALRKSEAKVAELEQKTSRLTALETEMAEMKKALARLTSPHPDGRPSADAAVSTDGKAVAAR